MPHAKTDVSRPASENFPTWPWIVGLSFIGLLIRLHGLAHRGFWQDEIDVWISCFSSFRSTGTGPIAPWIYGLPMRLLHRADSLVFRLPSLVFGVALIPVMAAIGDAVDGRRAAVAAALLTALSPSAVFYSQEARPYALLMLLCALAALAFIKGYLGGHRRYAVLYATALVLSFLNHALTSHVAGALGLFMGVDSVRDKLRNPTKNLYLGLTAVSFVGLSWLHFRYRPSQYLNGAYTLGPVLFIRSVLYCLGTSIHRITGGPLTRFDGVAVLYFALVVVGCGALWKKQPRVAVSFLTVLGASLVMVYASLGPRSYWAWGRYLSHLFPFYVGFAAVGLAKLPLRGRWSAIPFLAAALLFVPGLRDWAKTEVFDRSTPYRANAEVINQAGHEIKGAILLFSHNSYTLWEAVHFGLFRSGDTPWYGRGKKDDLYQLSPLSWTNGLPTLSDLGPAMKEPLAPGRYALLRTTQPEDFKPSCATVGPCANIVSCRDAAPIGDGVSTIATALINEKTEPK